MQSCFALWLCSYCGGDNHENDADWKVNYSDMNWNQLLDV